MSERKNYWTEWRRLPITSKISLLKAGVCLLIIGGSLRLMPFRKFKNFYGRMIPPSPVQIASPRQVETITWAVKTAAYHLPITLECLPQALATKYFLRNMKDMALNIGVQRSEPSLAFEAHAWVTHQNKIIIGELQTAYQPLWIWK